MKTIIITDEQLRELKHLGIPFDEMGKEEILIQELEDRIKELEPVEPRKILNKYYNCCFFEISNYAKLKLWFKKIIKLLRRSNG